MKTIHVRFHCEAEGWWAESDDLPGWTAAGETFDEVRAMALELPAVLGEPVLLELAEIVTEVPSGVISGTCEVQVSGEFTMMVSMLPARPRAKAPMSLTDGFILDGELKKSLDTSGLAMA